MIKNTLFSIVAIFCFSYTIAAQNFITIWDLTYPGLNANGLLIGTNTSGTASYTWQELSPGSASGSGTWEGTTLLIDGLPTNSTIKLEISPTNFISINMGSAGIGRSMTGLDRDRLIEVFQWGTTAWSSMELAFFGCSNLQITATDLPNLSGVTSMFGMFEDCTNLNSPTNMGSWNTASVLTMESLFKNATSFNQPIGSWNTAAVTNMKKMFDQAAAFNQPIGAWTTSSVNTMEGMFDAATAFNQPIGTWNTVSLNNIISMFADASSFNQPIGTWNTSSVTNMTGVFINAIAFNQPVGSWNTAAVLDMSGLFAGALAFNQPIGAWITTSVTNMSFMFLGADAFNQPIGGWNTAAANNMFGMFEGAIAFNQDISTWNTSSVFDMREMFLDADNFNQNLGTWSLSSGVLLAAMLSTNGMDCDNYTATLVGWNANPATADNLSLGAVDRQYGTVAESARANLTINKDWSIAGDMSSGTTCALLLPLQWLYIDGRAANDGNHISWATAAEINTSSFEIEHSSDGQNFSKIGELNAAYNSLEEKQYKFKHEFPNVGPNYYRIKQLDSDARFTYSDVVMLKNALSNAQMTISPNPVIDEVKISFTEFGSKKSISLYNSNEQIVLSRMISYPAESFTLDMSALHAGIYIVRVHTNSETKIHKVVKL